MKARPNSKSCVIYDDTCRGRGVGLTHTWIAGSALARARSVGDLIIPARSWAQALGDVLAANVPIRGIQFWGHGKWGKALIAGDILDVEALRDHHPLHAPLAEIRDRMTTDAYWWFRTCETFGCEAGHEFARQWAEFFDRRAAGHTFIIGPWQSGLHVLHPGESPDWSTDEGLEEGTPRDPQKARWSGPLEPRTITCLRMRFPS